MRGNLQLSALVLAALLLGCATPAVDRAMQGFDEATYAEDLNVCRG